jgi:hypothetical protein
VLGAALVLPQGVDAQNAVCSEPSIGGIGGIAPALRGGAMSIELQSARSAAPLEGQLPLRDERDEDLPWCTSADDPRCAPLPGDSAAVSMALRQPLAAAAHGDAMASSPASEEELTPHVGPSPCTGISNRVERPPRPIR